MRDAFLGRTSPDLDFTTSARPDEIEPILARWGGATWDMGREFGTIGARRGDTIVEVTTYRADAYDGVTRKPVVAFGDSLEDDLKRRDFTMNAMALRLPDLTFVDPYAGLPALLDRTLRTPGPRGVLRRRPAADDARGTLRRPARRRARARSTGRDDRDGHHPGSSRPSGSATS